MLILANGLKKESKRHKYTKYSDSDIFRNLNNAVQFTFFCCFHIALFFDYGYKVTTNFYTCKFFLTFFVLFFIAREYTYICRFSRWSCVPVVWWSCSGGGVPVVCRSWSCVRVTIFRNQMHAHTYAHTHVRARGFLDSNF